MEAVTGKNPAMTAQELYELIARYDRWVYGLLLTYAMGKTGPLPMVAGFISHSGALDVFAVLGTVLVGTLIGTQLRFAVGRHFAPWLYERFPRFAPWLALGAAGVERYDRLLLPAYRFAKGTFSLISVGAGASRLGWARFTAFDTLGAIGWTVTWVLMGSAIAAAGSQVDPRWAAYAGLAILVTGMVVATVFGRQLKQALLPLANDALAAATARRHAAAAGVVRAPAQ